MTILNTIFAISSIAKVAQIQLTSECHMLF